MGFPGDHVTDGLANFAHTTEISETGGRLKVVCVSENLKTGPV